MVAAPVFSNTRKKGVAGRRDLTVNLHEGEKFMMWKVDVSLLFYVALGGALGSVGRYLVAAALKGVWGNDFPWEMVFVNTFGCILVGFCAAFLYTKLPHPKWAMLLYWGFIGGFTAFSSFIKEGLHFFLHGEHITGFLYLLLQNTLGLLAASLAFWAGKTFF